MQELIYTARTIRELENETRKPFTTILADYSMDTVILLVKKGLGQGKTDEDAINVIDAFLKEKEGRLEDIYIKILESLEDAGFLPSLMKVEEIKKALKNPQE